MADRALIARAPWRSWRAAPVALRIGVLYLGARVLTTAFLVLAATLAGPGSRFGPHATLQDLVAGWDAQWYWLTAVNGYPATLPLTESGLVAENQWAFMPLYAYLAAAFGWLLQSWVAAAVLISIVAGYLSCLVLYRILLLRTNETTSTWAVVFFASGPLAAMFQVAYAESLLLLWLFLALWCVMRRRYAWLYLLIPLMGFTRPGVLAFALFLAFFGLWRWSTRRREVLGGREIAHIILLGVLAVVIGFSWQVIAGFVTGNSGAYLSTELAWRRNWIPGEHAGFMPVEGFVSAAAFWFTQWGVGAVTGYVVLAVSVVAVGALLIFEPHVKRLGVELRLWTASYLVYLLLVFFPQSSIFRLLLPVSPLWGAVAMPRSRVYRWSVLVACVTAQAWWIFSMYAFGNTYWQIP